VIPASKDTTLFEVASALSSQLSNGAGSYGFIGRTNQAAAGGRRVLVEFPLPGNISSAGLLSAHLSVTKSRGGGSATQLNVHRVLSAWVEGNADAPGVSVERLPAVDLVCTASRTGPPQLFFFCFEPIERRQRCSLDRARSVLVFPSRKHPVADTRWRL
jgi:hypothetical protein